MTFYVTVAGGGVAPIALDGGTNAPPSNVYARVLAGGRFFGTVDGAGPAAAIGSSLLKGIDVTPSGAVVFGDDNQLRRYSPGDGVITTIGNVSDGTTPTDGNGFSAQFPGLIRAAAFINNSTILFASQNQLWVGSGPFDNALRLGPGSFSFDRIGGAADNASGSALGDGNTVRFDTISAIAYDPDANAIYLIDRSNTRVLVGRQTGLNLFSPTSWTFSLVAGGTPGFADGIGAAAQFNNPDGLALGDDNALYIGDNFNNRLRRINLENQSVTTVAGDGSSGVVDGTPGSFNDIRSVVSDGAGSIYMNDASRLRVYRNGRLYTITTGNNSLLGDGYTDGAGQQGSNRLAINRATGTIYTIGLNSSNVPQLVAFEAVVP